MSSSNSVSSLNSFVFEEPPSPGSFLFDVLAYSWKAHTLLSNVSINIGATSAFTDDFGFARMSFASNASLTATTSRAVPTAEITATNTAVNLQDAIAILKMIVGLPLNGANQPISPYQTLAADYDGNGTIGLNDAIAVLKHVVGLDAPQPTWHFVQDIDPSIPAKTGLNVGVPTGSLVVENSGNGTAVIGLVGYLSGDVDGSFVGVSSAQSLDTVQPNYFSDLLARHSELSPSQFGIYL